MRPGYAAAVVVLAASTAGAVPVAPDDSGERAWLGIGMDQGADGVLVTEVVEDSPADQAGVVARDEILAVDDQRVRSTNDLVRILNDYGVGEQVELGLSRAGEVLTLRVVLGEKLGRNEILARRLVGQKAPDFDLQVVSGLAPGSLSDLQGRVVILDFFATHCGPCAEAHERLARAGREHAADGLVVLAVSPEPRGRLAMYGRDYPDLTIAQDATTQGRRAGTVFGAYSPYENDRPIVVVIDREGVVRFAGIGGRRGAPSAGAALENVDHALFTAERALRAR